MTGDLTLTAEVERRKQRALAVIADLSTGMKAGDVARKYGMSAPYVSKLINQSGIGPRQLAQAKFADIAEAYRAGAPICEICEKFGVKRRSVWTAVERHGVPLRKSARGKA